MKTSIPRTVQSKGFALVITVSLLGLLTVIALGFLSLSAITLRSGTQEQAQMEARSNAKLALQIAIGELQKQIGPDQRITANGDITDPDPTNPVIEVKHPHWMGVWNSWKAGDGTSFHRSVEGESLIGMAPTYQAGRNDYFRSWLLSLNPDDSSNWLSARDLTLDGEPMPDADETALRLVGKGSLGLNGDEDDFVSVRLMDVMPSSASSGFRGRYGWWVGDESQKARLMGDSYASETDLTLAQKISRGQAPGSTGTIATKGLEKIAPQQDLKLTALASHNTLDVIPGVKDVPVDPSDANSKTVRASQYNFHHTSPYPYGVIADVREGGLKRDLSALLELPINPAYNTPEYMLYQFKTKDGAPALAPYNPSGKPQECVPIQDLAAFYQLYDSVSDNAVNADPLRKSNARGVQYAPHPTLGGINGPHLRSTDFGTTSLSPIYPREYSAAYRQPRIIKVQFLASLFSKLIEPEIPKDRNNPFPNTHELLIGITPSITFWNPTNLPVIFQMKENDPAMARLTAQMMRFRELPLQVRYKKNGQTVTNYITFQGMGGINDGTIFNLYWAGIHEIKMEPGEVKTLSLPYSGDVSSLKSQFGYSGHWNQGWAMSNFFMKTDTWFVGHEVKVGWEPDSFMHFNNSAAAGSNNGNPPRNPATDTDVRHVVNGRLRFKKSDTLGIEIDTGANAGIGWMNNASSYQDYNAATSNWDRYNALMDGPSGQAHFSRGMTGGATTLAIASRTAASIVARSSSNAGWPFMHFSYMAGVETKEGSNGGIAGGRKFASRPFLHSSPLNAYPFMDGDTGNARYNFGWNWAVDMINDVLEAPVMVTATGSGYWGGGYTPESGTTHIIQQEIPLAPPMSIAALSHARLGGWSISDQTEMTYAQMIQPGAAIQRQLTRAIGFGGLAPNTLQAIGNSYAHPQIRADKTYETFTRTAAGGSIPMTFADHSYLANKALWDEYFFSSITPQRSEVQVFEASDRTVEAVADDFFFNNKPIPNRRIMPYMANLDESKLANMMAEKSLFTDGLADKIAAHLMVEGPFNINSTSVEGWKIFLSSLKKKPVAYLDKTSAMAGVDPVLSTSHDGTPVGQVGLAGGAPFTGSPINPRDANQWTSWRALTDDEIEELAYAMVRQVKLRGPFLSLSEFVNRRLEGSTGAAGERSVKGALQAALDDPEYPPKELADADGKTGVAINSAFRADNRKFSPAEVASMSYTNGFQMAAEGPVAYGSSAYIDQADILRGLAEQITPRGDTFVIRTYGDSIDASGKVVARAWCEAVVQRLPDYVDSSDENHEKPSDDTAVFSAANKTFGRKLEITSFRWLDASEI